MSAHPNPTAWITGAGTAWGRAAALALAVCGYDLVLQDRTPLHVDETAERATALGRLARVYITETGKGLPTHAFVEQANDDFGRADVLVNAVWAAPGDTVLELDEWSWQHSLEINLTGPLLLMQAVADIQRAHGGGMIFNMLPCLPAMPPTLAATTAALEALSESAAAEFLAYNIVVHTIRLNAANPPETNSPEISQIIQRLL